MMTFVSKSFKDAIEKRLDWLEIEAKIKEIYGDDWKLVPYERKFKNEEQTLQEGLLWKDL